MPVTRVTLAPGLHEPPSCSELIWARNATVGNIEVNILFDDPLPSGTSLVVTSELHEFQAHRYGFEPGSGP